MSALYAAGLASNKIQAAEDIPIVEKQQLPQQSFPKPTLSQLLAGMGAALNSGNFTMSLVYIHDGQIDSLRFSHLTTATDRFDKLEHLQGVQRKIISQNGETYLVMGNEKLLLSKEDGTPVDRWRHQLERLAKNIPNYRVSISGLSRIAGRPAFELDFISKTHDRYSTRLWLDAITNLPLRIDALNNKGRIIEQILTINLQYPANLSAANFLIDENLSQLTRNAEIKTTKASHSAWQIGWLPAGYELSVYNVKQLKNDQLSEQWVYSDGLTSLSVFVENNTTTIESQKQHSRIQKSAFTRGDTLIFDMLKNNIRITVVGDIPRGTAEKIADSVRIKTGSNKKNNSKNILISKPKKISRIQ